MDPQNSANLRPSDFMWLQTPEPVSAVCSPSSPQISEDGDPTLVHMGKDSAHSSNHWYDFPTSRESLQVNSTATNTGAIPHRTQDNSESLRDTGTVFDLQRQPHPPRERKSYICGFMGRDCPFMKNKEGGVFRNMAGLREDFLRHLNAFQCTRCGLRFGRRSGLKRHVEERKIPCKAIDTNHLREGCNWVTKELGLAVENVRRAKLYDELKAAMEKCKGLCDLTGQTERKRKKQAQRKSARQIRSGQISTQSDGTLTPTESESDNTANARADAANSPAETISGLGNLGLEEFQQMLGVSGILPVGSQALTSNDADVPIVGMNHDLGSHSGNNTIDPTLIQYPHMNTTVQTPPMEWNTHPAQEIGAASRHPTNSTGSFFDPNIMGDTMWPQNERMDGTRNPTFESQPVSIMGNGGYSSHHFPSNVADLDQYRDFNPSSKPYSAMPASPYAPAATSQSYDAWVFLQTANLLEPGSYNY